MRLWAGSAKCRHISLSSAKLSERVYQNLIPAQGSTRPFGIRNDGIHEISAAFLFHNFVVFLNTHGLRCVVGAAFPQYSVTCLLFARVLIWEGVPDFSADRKVVMWPSCWHDHIHILVFSDSRNQHS